MSECNPTECPTGKNMQKMHEAYDKTHVAIIKQTTTLDMFMGVVERDRDDRKEAEKLLFTKVNAVDKALGEKADKDKVVSKSGATIAISLILLMLIILTFVGNFL